MRTRKIRKKEKYLVLVLVLHRKYTPLYFPHFSERAKPGFHWFGKRENLQPGGLAEIQNM